MASRRRAVGVGAGKRTELLRYGLAGVAGRSTVRVCGRVSRAVRRAGRLPSELVVAASRSKRIMANFVMPFFPADFVKSLPEKYYLYVVVTPTKLMEVLYDIRRQFENRKVLFGTRTLRRSNQTGCSRLDGINCATGLAHSFAV